MHQDPYYLRKEVSNSDLSKLKGDNIPLAIKEAAQHFGSLADEVLTEPLTADTNKYIKEGRYSEEEVDRALLMKAAFLKDPICEKIYRMARTQEVMIKHGMEITHDGETFRLDTRCKWDFWMPPVNWGADYKVTAAVSQKQFEEAVNYFDYDRGRAWYMDIAGSNQDMIIGVSRKNFQVFKVPIKRGDRLYTAGRNKYSELAHKYYHLYINNQVAA